MKWRLPTVGLERPSGPPISTLVLGGTLGPRPQCLSTWLDEVIHACHPVLNEKSVCGIVASSISGVDG